VLGTRGGHRILGTKRRTGNIRNKRRSDNIKNRSRGGQKTNRSDTWKRLDVFLTFCDEQGYNKNNASALYYR
jgi:hypothetical protein